MTLGRIISIPIPQQGFNQTNQKSKPGNDPLNFADAIKMALNKPDGKTQAKEIDSSGDRKHLATG